MPENDAPPPQEDLLEDLLWEVSAALDGEGPMPAELDPRAEAFLADARRIRSSLRLEEAGAPPDVAAAVLRRAREAGRATDRASRAQHRRSARDERSAGVPATPGRGSPTALVAAAVFVVAAAVGALAFRPGGPVAPEVALADVGEQVLQAQHDVTSVEARVTLTERGAHPGVELRRYEGTLRYQAPERLWLHVEETSQPPEGWPANDFDLVVDEGSAWERGLRDCPVASQPACLAPSARVVEGLAPFAPDWAAPLDLVVPAGAFLPAAAVPGTTAATLDDGSLVVETSVSRLEPLVGGLRSAGALRPVHATDRARLVLDGTSATIRRLTITAAGTEARRAWAATNGYDDREGEALLDLTVTATDLADGAPPAPPSVAEPPGAGPGPATGEGPASTARAVTATDAHFTDEPAPAGPAPSWLPDGFAPHRSGTLAGAGPVTTVRSWTDGRAWIRIDATEAWDRPRLFGDLGDLVRPVDVGSGTGFVGPGGSVLALHAEGVDVAVSGSVPLGVLVDVAASLPVSGLPLPGSWAQADVLDALPDGALAPPGPLLARYVGADLVVAVPGPGSTGATLSQRPGAVLDPPPRDDLIGAPVRGVEGRYSPVSGTLTWVEGGWRRELRAQGLDLGDLTAVADGLVPG